MSRSNRVGIATLLFDVIASVLWIDVAQRRSSAEAIDYVLEESDYFYLLQSREIHVEFRQAADVLAPSSATVVVGAGSAGFDAHQVADRELAVSSVRIAVAATGLPAEPVPEAGVLSFADAAAKQVASCWLAMQMTGGAVRTKVAEYLRLGARTKVSLVVLVLLILNLLLSICGFSYMAIYGSEFQRHGLDKARPASRTGVAAPSHKQVCHEKTEFRIAQNSLVAHKPLASAGPKATTSTPASAASCPFHFPKACFHAFVPAPSSRRVPCSRRRPGRRWTFLRPQPDCLHRSAPRCSFPYARIASLCPCTL